MDFRMFRIFLNGYWELKKEGIRIGVRADSSENVMSGNRIKELNSKIVEGYEIRNDYYMATRSNFMLTEDFLLIIAICFQKPSFIVRSMQLVF